MGTNDSTTTKQQQEDVTRVGGPDDSRTVNTDNSTRPDDSMKRKESPQGEEDSPTRNS